MNTRALKQHQIEALQALAANPAAWVESGTLGMLRKRGFVDKVISRDANGTQKTTSPLTPEGRDVLNTLTSTIGYMQGRGAS